MSRKKSRGPICIVAGTRPEVIKLAPVWLGLRARLGADRLRWISTGQHKELELQTLSHFCITPDRRLATRDDSPSLLQFCHAAMRGLAALFQELDPVLVIVQGDTASAMAGAFTAFHAGIPVAHVEAGLRSDDIHDPFPEEAYRRLIDSMSELHFAPTPFAASRLKAEGFSAASVFSTGNTAIDALALADRLGDATQDGSAVPLPQDGRLLFVTLHRRESWGEPLEKLCVAVRKIVERYPDVHAVLPVHVNPVVETAVRRILGGVPRIHLTPPMDFAVCHGVIRRSYLILTDSGGIVEEAPSYRVPVLILRNRTERPEAITEGFAELTGTDAAAVFEAACRILDDPSRHAAMQATRNPYGDGHAAERIALGIDRFLAGRQPCLSQDEQFPG